MNLADQLALYLQDNGIGTVNTDIFVGELPYDTSDCIAVQFNGASPEPNKSIPYYTQGIDIWARYNLFDDGYRKLQDIFDLLHRTENYEITGYHVYLSYALGMIDDLDRDVQRRHIFKLSLGFVYRKSSEFS